MVCKMISAAVLVIDRRTLSAILVDFRKIKARLLLNCNPKLDFICLTFLGSSSAAEGTMLLVFQDQDLLSRNDIVVSQGSDSLVAADSRVG